MERAAANKNKKIKKKLTKQVNNSNIMSSSSSSSSSSIVSSLPDVAILSPEKTTTTTKTTSPTELLMDNIGPILRKFSFTSPASGDVITSPPIKSSTSFTSPASGDVITSPSINNISQIIASPTKDNETIIEITIPQCVPTSHIDKFASFLTYISKSEKPWYLYTSNVYNSSKNIVVYITSFVDPIKYEKAIGSAEFAINKYIVPRIGTDEIRTLTVKLDSNITTFLNQTDTKIDDSRVKLADALLLARSNIIAYFNRVYEHVSTKKDQTVTNITEIVAKAKSKKEQTYTKIAELKAASVTATYATASVLLEKAQPFMKQAVDRAIPIVTKTHELAQPYVTYAEPYVVPYISKAKGALFSNSYTGPIVRAVAIKASEGFINVENYVMAKLVDHDLTVDNFGQD
jgi:hypothetical protein